MVSRSKAVTDDHVCVAVHPCKVNKTIRIAASAVMDCLESLARLLDNLNWILIKLAKISVSAMACFLVGSRGRHHGGVFGWRCSGLVYASYLKSGTRSSGLAKSKLALLLMNPTSLYLDACA